MLTIQYKRSSGIVKGILAAYTNRHSNILQSPLYSANGKLAAVTIPIPIVLVQYAYQ